MKSNSKNDIKRLTLGTAQFGKRYGVSNESCESVSIDEIERLLEYSLSHGITNLDTAFNYGNSERILGEIGVTGFTITSKITLDEVYPKSKQGKVLQDIEGSLARLKVSKLDTLLVHNPLALGGQDANRLYAELKLAQSSGMVKNLGISIYCPRAIKSILDEFALDVIQAPCNPFDDRIERFLKAPEKVSPSLVIQIRSIFLQGLLLMSAESRPSFFDRWHSRLARWDQWLIDNQISALAACVSFVFSREFVDQIVVGVVSRDQLQNIVNIVNENSNKYPSDLAMNEDKFLDPFNWDLLV